MRVASVIAAHNEAAIIGETVAHTLRVMAPHPVYVIADRCTDATAARASEAGARVVERHEGSTGKGAAIGWWLATAREANSFDAVLILDADSRLRPGAPARLTAALEAGAAAAQGLVYPVFDTSSALATLVAYNEWLSQMADDRLRACLGWPVRLRGTGMLIRTDVLRDAAPRLRTNVEDTELTFILMAHRQRIVFVPDAVVDDPKPCSVDRLAAQRARWLQGDREIWRDLRPVVLTALASGHPGVWWLTSSLLLKPRSLVTVAKVALIGGLWPLAAHPVAKTIVILLVASLAATVAYYALGVFVVPAPWRRPVLRALVLAPAYMAMWIRALIWSLRSRKAWLRARD